MERPTVLSIEPQLNSGGKTGHVRGAAESHRTKSFRASNKTAKRNKGNIVVADLLRKRLFVTVGTHTQQFDRLIMEIDRLVEAEKINVEVFAQTGNCRYEPKNFKFRKFLGESEYEKMIVESDIIISHAGAGSIINALKNIKPLVIVPRLVEFGEHTNSHQVDLAKAMHEKKKAIACMDISRLGDALKMAENFRPNMESDRQRLVAALVNYTGKFK